jgi:hypothetical protein
MIPMQILGKKDSMRGVTGALFEGIRQGNPESIDEFRRSLRRGVRFLAARKLPVWLVDDGVREVLDRVTRGIQSGDLEDPVGLLPFVRMHLVTYVREVQDEHIWIMSMRDATSLNCLAGCRKVAQAFLLGLSDDERECLFRFYVRRHDDDRISRELRMPAAESLTLRARVRAQYSEACKRSALALVV